MKLKFKQASHRLKIFFVRNKKLTYGASAIFIIGVSVLGFKILTSNDPEVSRTQPDVTIAEPEKPKEIPKKASPLTGIMIDPELAKRPVTAVVIENSPDARPQSSLPDAGLVFESIAEGGITRFLAFYQESRPDPIGPVRSLRPYFNDWILAFDASVAHVGGSAEALNEAITLDLKDLDQFANGGSYYRITERFAPHNVYTDFDKLDALNKKLGFTSSEFTPIPRKNPKPLSVAKATDITVNISSYTYQTDYKWLKSENKYQRSTAGVIDTDKQTGKQIKPDVLVVIEASYSISSDGRYHYDLVGEGKATIFQDGNVIVGNWRKPARDSQIKFIDDNGDNIDLNTGQLWVTAISPSQEVTYTP